LNISFPEVRVFHNEDKFFRRALPVADCPFSHPKPNTLPLPDSGITRIAILLFDGISTYQPPCPGVCPVLSLLKSPSCRLSKFSLYKNCDFTLLQIKKTTNAKKVFFFIMI